MSDGTAEANRRAHALYGLRIETQFIAEVIDDEWPHSEYSDTSSTERQVSKMTDNTVEPIDVWLRIPESEEWSEAEANTYLSEHGYRVDWYLTAVGLVTSIEFDTLADAYDWLGAEGFVNYTIRVSDTGATA